MKTVEVFLIVLTQDQSYPKDTQTASLSLNLPFPPGALVLSVEELCRHTWKQNSTGPVRCLSTPASHKITLDIQ